MGAGDDGVIIFDGKCRCAKCRLPQRAEPKPAFRRDYHGCGRTWVELTCHFDEWDDVAGTWHWWPLVTDTPLKSHD